VRHSYAWSGFSFTLDPKKLRSGNRYQDGTWLVAAGVYGRGVLRRGALAAAKSGGGAHPPYHYVTDDVRVIPSITRGGTLRLRVETVRAKVTAHRLADAELEIFGYLRGEAPDAGMALLRRVAGTMALSCPVTYAGTEAEGVAFAVRIPLRDLLAGLTEPASGDEPEDGTGWRIDMALDAGQAGDDDDAEPVRLVLDEDLTEGRYPLAGREIVVSRSSEGYLWLYVRTPRPVITKAGWRPDGTLAIAGEYATVSGEHSELVLSCRDQREERTFPMTADGESFRAELPVTALTTPAGVLPLRAGKWDLRVRAAGSEATAYPALAIKLGHALLERLPIEMEKAGRRYVLQDHRHDKPVLEVHSDLRQGERGPYAQRRVRIRRYRVRRRVTPLRPAVLFDSYTGKQYSDSPRAIHQELVRRGVELEHLWVVRDAQVAVPDSARPVRLWGSEWYEALARSRYVVTNAHLPAWFRRREGQVVLQTWHGTPLKRIGFDIEDVQFANAGYLDKVAQEVRNWSYLVSPNRFSTPILRRAFRYDGEVIEAGYPRNDVLRGPDRDLIGEQVRRRLGLPPGKRTILYAPTWRDDSYYGPGKYKLDLRIDLGRAAAALGDDYVLLIRPHPNVVDTVPETADGFVRDVADYPDIAELFLAADVLLTDYSSLMFDYANTGRPMLFFTYDLEHYRDELRGFYFDFEEQAPGPLLRTSDEVIEALRSLDDVTGTYREAYARFAERFCDLDDGKAAGRVVDRLLEED
jgi:CDP-glycerol glycerophosphotransferase